MSVEAYNYLSHLKEHLQDTDKVFNQKGVLPRQINFYPPSDHITPCNFKCFHCAGQLCPKELVAWEETGLELLDNLKGGIPYHIYSGFCTETTMNPFLLTFLKKTKEYGNCFGVKTNGSFLTELEESEGFLSEMCDISNSTEDYFSVSLDAGFARSHSRIKRIPPTFFNTIIDGMYLLGQIRGGSNTPALRVSYLLSDLNDSEEEILRAVDLTNRAGFDSIRFSQPQPLWGLGRKSTTKWWAKLHRKNMEYGALFDKFDNRLPGKATAFYVDPCPSPSDGYARCAYGYYQITLSHDGFMYRCTSLASSKFKEMRLGKITSDMGEFRSAIARNQSEHFDPGKCFSQGAYCCRAAVATNDYFNIVWQDVEL